MESLDQASLRRFPWKIRFDWLKPAQRWALFAQEFIRLGGDLAEAADWKGEIWGLEQLTPGDFAAVVRQYELWDETPGASQFMTACASRWRRSEGSGLRQRPPLPGGGPPATPKRETTLSTVPPPPPGRVPAL